MELFSDIATCARPEGYDPNIEEACPNGPGGVGGPSNAENPSIYNADGSVKPAETAGEVF